MYAKYRKFMDAWSVPVLAGCALLGIGYGIADAALSGNWDALDGWGVALLLGIGMVLALRESSVQRRRHQLLEERYTALKAYKESILDEWKEDA